MFVLYIVRGNSMVPTLQPGDWMLVRTGPRIGVRRLDLLIIRAPDGKGKSYLKRVVGLPGDNISLNGGILTVNDVWVDEPYLVGLPATTTLCEKEWTVGPEEYFVMGDNRSQSIDSREFGPIRNDMVVGRVCFRLWPVWRLSI